MRKAGKTILWSILSLALLVSVGTAIFLYKITHGLPVTYETKRPRIVFPPELPAFLVFSKTTAYRHGESIRDSKQVFREMALRNHWFVYETEDGGVFNTGQLRKFKAVIFNNSTGRVLNDEQQRALSQYVEQGGVLLGIHGAGDNSHHWPWYEQNLVGGRFSHHPLRPQLQKATVHIDRIIDPILTQTLPPSWIHKDEWYIYFSQPKGVQVIAWIDGERIKFSGNMLWIRDKNFGMGKHHPVAWYRNVGKGRTFYTSMGHAKEVWREENFVRLLENALRWTLR